MNNSNFSQSLAPRHYLLEITVSHQFLLVLLAICNPYLFYGIIIDQVVFKHPFEENIENDPVGVLG
ncbi:MAG: hypothetical protein IH840_16150 [Candidatus Heimdallarchaeota archaeon]|nr:hypothetical protein [Candidatus Heimdallarchaeota archaeon]